MDLGDIYNVAPTGPMAGPAPSRPYPRPSMNGNGASPGVSGNFGITAGLSSTGMGQILGGFVVMALAFWLLHT